MSSTLHSGYSFLDCCLTHEEVDRTLKRVVSINGYSQKWDGVSAYGQFIPLSFDSVTTLARHLPLEVLARHPSCFFNCGPDESMVITYALDPARMDAEGWSAAAACLDGCKGIYHTVSFSIWATPSKDAGLLEFRVHFRLNAKRYFSIAWSAGFSEKEATANSSQGVEDYRRHVSALVKRSFSELQFPGCSITDKGEVHPDELSDEDCDVGKCWESLLSVSWLKGPLIKAAIRPRIALSFAGPNKSGARDIAALEALGKVLNERGGLLNGFTHLDWKGFYEVDPDWVQMGSLSARLATSGTLLEMPLGSIRSGKDGSSSSGLYLYSSAEGSVLAMKGGGAKLVDKLTEHFGTRWVKGVSPMVIKGKLGTPKLEEPSEPKVPPAYYRVPPYFSIPGGGAQLRR